MGSSLSTLCVKIRKPKAEHLLELGAASLVFTDRVVRAVSACVRRRLAVLFTFTVLFVAMACGGGQEERRPVQEPEPTEHTQIEEPTDRTTGEDVGYTEGPQPRDKDLAPRYYRYSAGSLSAPRH